MTYGLGRVHMPDQRDGAFPMSTLLDRAEPDELTRSWRYWNAEGWWGDQLSTPHCVAFSWAHWLEDGPTTQPETPHGTGPVVDTTDLYNAAQLVDEWPGEGYDGTSVRAGAKILQQRGFISAYHWASPNDPLMDVIDAILTTGPVVVGTNWYRSMFTPDDMGFLQVEGSIAGGHAYLLNGVNVKRGVVRVKNSWGQDWGSRGHALLSFEDIESLLLEDGEACLADEVRV